MQLPKELLDTATEAALISTLVRELVLELEASEGQTLMATSLLDPLLTWPPNLAVVRF